MTLCLAVAVLASFSSRDWMAKVGKYTVAVHRSVRSDTIDETDNLRLIDSRSRIVTSITDFRVGVNDDLWHKEAAETRDLNRDGTPEIVFTAWTGGAHGSIRYFIWSLGSRPRCLLGYDKNNIGEHISDFQFVDLDGDRIPEIHSWYDGLAYTYGGSYWPNIPVVLRLENGRYVDRTSRYRRVLDDAFRKEWADFASADKKVPPGAHSLSSSIASLLVLSEIQGKYSRVHDRIQGLLPKPQREWLSKADGHIRKIARDRRKRFFYPHAYDLRANLVGQY